MKIKSEFSSIINKNHSIYIPYLPDEKSKNVIDTAKKLKFEGYDVIPHLPSRTILHLTSLQRAS